MSLAEYLAAAPKAELHVHLEGSIQPETLLSLARRNKVALPAPTLDGLKQWFRYQDFDHFIRVYVTITRCLREVEDYELITYELATEMWKQNIRYAEVTFSPSTHAALGVAEDVYLEGMRRGRRRARRDYDVEIQWVFDIVRNVENVAETADYTLAVAREGLADGVVALGLGGLERGYPPEPFAPWFERAHEAGLRAAPHAGELAGPASIWGAIRALGADRIGHGVRAAEDPALVEYLAGEEVPLEICPTSNLRLGVVPSLAEHPVARLLSAGVPVTINTDDPPLFNTTLTRELIAVAEAFQWDVQAMDGLLLAGLRRSFLAPERKAALEKVFLEEMAELRGRYFPAA